MRSHFGYGLSPHPRPKEWSNFLDWVVAFAEPEPGPGPEAGAAQPEASPPTGPRLRWPLLGLVLRGRSLGPSAVSGGATRPTFVIGASASPRAVASPSPQVAASPSPSASEYVIQPGDTLRSIAQDVYGAADQWPRIYDANREQIGADPDTLQTGTRLRIP
ncbi:MAG: LysM peptidoglycan-binding domain-containing protein [Chloroflexi bacterium]|nr:MAG: LysM peptidoglycan-binding domain-containing protein [Chloroflexota bacterium]